MSLYDDKRDVNRGAYHFSCSKVKASDPTGLYNQAFNSRAAVSEIYLGKAGNITEAPPVADEARRCWRKTRSIAPAPRAIGDYVLRGLNGLRSKTHEPHSFKLRRICGRMCRAANREAQAKYCGTAFAGAQGDSPCFAFLLQAFSFSNKKKMPKRCIR